MFGRLAGYEDVNDAERLCRHPAMRWVLGDRAIAGSAASAGQMGRFETKWLSRTENLAVLADLPGQLIDKVHERRLLKRIALVMDSSESPTYGNQKGWAEPPRPPANLPDAADAQDKRQTGRTRPRMRPIGALRATRGPNGKACGRNARSSPILKNSLKNCGCLIRLGDSLLLGAKASRDVLIAPRPAQE